MNILPDRQQLLMSVSGELDALALQILHEEAFLAIQKYDIHAALIDGSGLSASSGTVLDVYQVPMQYLTRELPLPFKLAILVPQKMLPLLRFFAERDAPNTFQLFIFSDREKAQAWVFSEEANTL